MKNTKTIQLVLLLIAFFSLVALLTYAMNKKKEKVETLDQPSDLSIYQLVPPTKVVEVGLSFEPETLKPGETTIAKLYVKNINNQSKSIDGTNLFFSLALDEKINITESDIPDSFDSDLTINGKGFPIIIYNKDKRFINLALPMYRGTFHLEEGTVIYSFPLTLDKEGTYTISLRQPGTSSDSVYVPVIKDSDSKDALLEIYPTATVEYKIPIDINTAPTISGTPETSVNENEEYSFIPTATDAEGDRLTFSILNKPSWATFDTETGTLSGKPSFTNSGDNSNIQISVSDGNLSANLPAFNITVNNVDRPPVVTILTPSNNAQLLDGSPLPISASVTDPDGDPPTAVLIEIKKADGSVLEQINLTTGLSNVYNGIWQTPVAGQITFTANATVKGVITKSAPINITVLSQDISGISFDPVGGSYQVNKGEKFKFKIAVGNLNPDAIIYTLDGSDPLTNRTVYLSGSDIELGLGVTNVKIVIQKVGYANATLSTTYTITEKVLVGDVNGDNKIDRSDAMEILQAYLLGSATDLKTMDLNSDGTVDFLDVVEVAKLAKGDQ